jgi:hypothetical protein
VSVEEDPRASAFLYDDEDTHSSSSSVADPGELYDAMEFPVEPPSSGAYSPISRPSLSLSLSLSLCVCVCV